MSYNTVAYIYIFLPIRVFLRVWGESGGDVYYRIVCSRGMIPPYMFPKWELSEGGGRVSKRFFISLLVSSNNTVGWRKVDLV